MLVRRIALNGFVRYAVLLKDRENQGKNIPPDNYCPIITDKLVYLVVNISFGNIIHFMSLTFLLVK